MRSSSAAFEGAAMPKATTPPNSNGSQRRRKVIAMILSSAVVTLPRKSGGHRCHFLFLFSIAGARASLTDSLRDAHQSRRQVQDRQYVDAAEHVLPPRHQRAQIFAQTEHDEGTDHAADQGDGA